MKKLFKFAGLAAALLALIGFILIMATHVANYKDGNLSGYFEGMNAIFGTGKTSTTVGSITAVGDFDDKLAWSGLLAWIFALLAILALVCVSVLPLLKVKALDKFLGLITLVAAGLLIVAAIFAFVSKGVLFAVNEYNNANDWTLGAGWVIGGILFILAGGVAACPVVLGLLGKK